MDILNIFKDVKFQVIAGFIVFAILLFGMNVFHITPAGHQTVKILFGKVDDIALTEGFHFVNPLAEYKDVSIRQISYSIELSTYTKDIQNTNLMLNIVYSLDNINALYRNIGINYETKILNPIIENAVKDVAGRWEASELVANREVAIASLKDKLLKDLNKEYIILSTVSLTNIEFSDEFEKAIEGKVTAIQKALEAKNNTVRIQEEANQKVIEAEGQAKAMRLKAQALATSPKLAEYEAIQKWDGKLPQVTGSNTPFINLNK